MKDLVYLASPYSTPVVDGNYFESRYLEALRATQWLIEEGYCVWSPIVQNHNLTLGRHLFHFWVDYNEAFIARCQRFFVLMLPGWLVSNGTCDDLRLARLHNKVVTFVMPVGGAYVLLDSPLQDLLQDLETKYDPNRPASTV